MTDATVSTLKTPLPDMVIAGRYRLRERLGSGGMGLVFLADVLATGERVALKFLDHDPSDDPSRAARFVREAKVALELRHPAATQVLDLGLDDGRLFIAFELVEGEDLRDVLRREGRLRFGEARTVALQVAGVLAMAHERGIVHRDVKPENVRMRREGTGLHVKMLDFGIAHLLRGASVRLTAEGTLAGTPRYMAPELVNEQPIDGRTDQYALALMLFEMLTGAFAMGGKNVPQIMMHQLNTKVPPLSWVDPRLGSPAVDALIARASEKDPAQRFPSMAAFAAALEALEVDEAHWPAPAAPPGEAVGSAALTRDQLPPEAPTPDASEVPTDKGREAVQRRPSQAPTREVRPLQLTESKVIELPTDPERPAVKRPGPGEEVSRRTVRGELKPPAPPKRARRWPLVVAAGVVLCALAAWWWFR